MKRALLLVAILALAIGVCVSADVQFNYDPDDGGHMLVFGDDNLAYFGTGKDVGIDFDGTNFSFASTAAATPWHIGAAGYVLNITLHGTFTVGVNDTGYDVKFFGDTSGKYFLWDTSADAAYIVGAVNITGNTTQTGSITLNGATGDLTTGDDLTVTDDASVGGDLSVTGTSTLNAISVATVTTDTWNPGSIADGAIESHDVTVTGAAIGDFVLAAAPVDVVDLVVSVQVTAADTVTITLSNQTSGAVDLDSGDWTILWIDNGS